MAPSEVPDWLPSGWTVQVKVHNYNRKVKTFCNVETGQKFSSKKEVLQYIEKNASQITPQPPSKQSKSPSKEIMNIEQSSENTEWLPPGWITEVKIKGGSGKPYKVYIDPESGSKYYSKPEVSRYLEKLKSVSTSSTAPKKTGSTPVIKDVSSGEKTSSMRDPSQNRRSGRSKSLVTKQDEVTVSNPSFDDATPIATAKGKPDELPTGWIKEINTKKSARGMKKFLCYTDPVSGYVFSSKKDALRYVETGSIESCVVKPKKIETNDPKLTSGSVPQKNGQSGNAKPVSSTPEKSAIVKLNIKKNGVDEQAHADLGDASRNNDATEKKTPDELPPGWIKEIKTRKSGSRSKKYEQYTDPLSGYIFNSKRDALCYLSTGDVGSCSVKPSKRDANDPELINGKISAIIHSLTGLESLSEPDAPQNNDTTVKTDSFDKAVNELPPDWITEVKTKKTVSGTRKYQLYVEPSTGYEFKSKKDALRYLETRDISKCAVKPKKREIDNNNLESMNVVVSRDEKKDEITITNSKIDEKTDEKKDEATITNSKIDAKIDERKDEVTIMNSKIDTKIDERKDKATITNSKIGAKINERKGEITITNSKIDVKTDKKNDEVTITNSKIDAKIDERKDEVTITNSKIGAKINERKDEITITNSKIDANSDEKKDEVTITNSKIDAKIEERKDEVTIMNSKIDAKIDERKDDIITTNPETSAKTETDAITITSPHTDEKKEEVPEWLPAGWTMVSKTKAGATPRKYKFYVESSTGRKFYSKPEVFRYLLTQKISPEVAKENKEVEHVVKVCTDNLTGGESSSIPDNNVDSMPVENKICSSGHKEVGVDESLKSLSVPDNSVDPKPIENKICSSEQEEVAVDKHLIDNVNVMRSTIDDLPPGWIKEIRIKTGDYGTKKETFYIDPLSGYEFRSLKDALRYVATRDIKSCAVRPKKPKTNQLNLANSSVEGKDSSPQCTTRSEMSAGKEGSVPEIYLNNNLTKEKPFSISIGSKRKLDTKKMGIATPSTTKARKKKRGKTAKRKRDSDSESSSEDEKSKKKQPLHPSIPTRTSKRLVGLEPNAPINLAVFDGAPVVHEAHLTQSINHVFIGDGAPQVHAGQPIQSISPEIGDAALQVQEDDQPQVIDPDVSPIAVDETEREVLLNDSAEEMLSAELLNKIEKALQEHAAIVEKIEKPIEEEEQPPQPQEVQAPADDVIEKPFEHQAVIYELIEKPLENNQAIIPNEKFENNQEIIENDLIENPVEVAEATPPPGMQSPQVFYPMMESWSDPCLEFAFKTLTGALPVQDNTITDDYFQRQVAPDPTVNNDGLSSFQDLPNYFQNPFSLNLNEPQRPVPRPGPAQQFPINPNYMPSSSSGATQQNPTWKQV